MLVTARKAAKFAQELEYEQFERSDLHQNAILKVLEIVGEAAARISDETKSAHPEIPWPNVIGLRNRIVHAYFGLDLKIVWKIVNESLPELVQKLEQLVPPEER